MTERRIEDQYRTLVDQRGPDECWPWRGRLDKEGYGRIGHRNLIAHRVGFQLVFGFLPAVVRHSCDVPDCQNPTHWRAGTQLDNIQDRVERGRSAAGERNGRAKLSAALVASLRERHRTGESARSLAAEAGVHPSALDKALAGITWRSVDG